MINRVCIKNMNSDLFKGKAIIILGARQVGKTTLINEFLKNKIGDCIFFNGDDADTHAILHKPTAVKLKNFIGNKSIIIIDEAQRIKDIGIVSKLIIDQIPNTQLIVTGSSSLELANETNEPLTGRKFEYQLFPLSTEEMISHHGLLEEIRHLNHRLIYGNYPEVITSHGKEKRILKLIAGSYLYKDLFAYEKIKKPAILEKLIRALSLQVGSEVSYNELSKLIGIDKETVEKYINLLEKAFVIFKLEAFSRNVRNEIKKGRKIYFYDNGIRNAVIGNFTPIELRTDIGALWENYFISERIKHNSYNEFYGKSYFWRTTQQQEVDYIEEVDGYIKAFEIKWNKNRNVRFPKTFTQAYNIKETVVVTPENYFEYLSSQFNP